MFQMKREYLSSSLESTLLVGEKEIMKTLKGRETEGQMEVM